MLQERLIGRVVVAWTKLESAIDGFIWHLLGLEIDAGRVLTGRLDAVGKIRQCRELGRLVLADEDFNELSVILDHIDISREDRNHIVHGMWAKDVNNMPISLSLRTKPLEPDQIVAEIFPDTRMRNIARDIDVSRYKLVRLLKRREPSPEIPDPPPPEG